ncbi:MAG TPA: DNA-binding response regulator [Bacteroidales bacterium]|nr:MAG: DNA-binding response regulator [Bacteroidetes bacterium GWF2_33_38]OFY89752.1 MAG: DNA-binding response regulator [Bacteroidetes bacterium RIFOXYA2_FULL_33_7]HBF88927.1 DNA-binding response regulator [Bacteroidales bacterium]
MSAKILIVEDEPKVAAFIKQGLEENKYDVDIAFDGLIGKNKGLSNNYDIIILDINIPYINGYELCKEIRKSKPDVSIIMLTALGTTDDKIIGFDAGADDYVVKPFEFRELLARIKAQLKRTKSESFTNNILSIADLEMNLDTKIVKRGGKIIELTAKEFMLLEFLIRNKGRVLSRATIAEKVWDITFDTGTNVIDVYVTFLRKKIDKDFSSKLIHTSIGMGYILKENEE